MKSKNMKTTEQKNTTTVIYDGACDLCQGGVRWLKRRALHGRFNFIACQSLDHHRFPQINKKECMQAIVVILPDGRTFSGAHTLPYLLVHLKGWRYIAALLRIWPLTVFTPLVYTWIAKNRYRLSCLIKN
ncbi:DUF393 domain-containing protein [candidate division KSB1 bacterium]|nr:DUF393 domain-containing protein [candidate division KSB1 bacterium]